jgi:hypothetical protein
MRTILLMELWTWLGTAAFLVWPDVYVLTATLLPFAIAAPVTDSVVDGYRVAVTPDRLIGRVESVRSTIALLIAPLGPLVAGFLLSTVSLRTTGAVFTACGIVLALWGTLTRRSGTRRASPSSTTWLQPAESNPYARRDGLGIRPRRGHAPGRMSRRLTAHADEDRALRRRQRDAGPAARVDDR